MSAHSGIPRWREGSHCLQCGWNLCQFLSLPLLNACSYCIPLVINCSAFAGSCDPQTPIPLSLLGNNSSWGFPLSGRPPPGFLSVTHVCSVPMPSILLCYSVPSLPFLTCNEFTGFMGLALQFLCQVRFCSTVILLLQSTWGPVHTVWLSSTTWLGS